MMLEDIRSYIHIWKERMENDTVYKAKFLAVAAGVLIPTFWLIGFIVQLGNYESKASLNIVICLFYAIVSPKSWLLIVLLSLGAFLVALSTKARKDRKNPVSIVDDRGVSIVEKDTYGSAHFSTKDETMEILEVGPIDKIDGVPLGQFPNTAGVGDGSMVVAVPCESFKITRHIVLMGSTGTGKTRGFAIPAALQAIKRRESLCFTDPKGELYAKLFWTLVQAGYTIKIFNLDEPTRSDSWNMLREVFSEDTGEMEERKVTSFATTVIENTSNGTDSYWRNGELSLLKMLIYYVTYLYDLHYKSRHMELCEVALKKVTWDKEKQKEFWISFQSPRIGKIQRREMLEALFDEIGMDDEQKAQLFHDIDVDAPVTNIAEVYRLLVQGSVGSYASLFSDIPLNHPAKNAYNAFIRNNEASQMAFINGLLGELQMFDSQDIRFITNNDDIDLRLPGKKPCAYFCIFPDGEVDQSVSILSSLFFYFLFRDLKKAADKETPEKRIAVNFILDEFANIGIIPGFAKAITTFRSRKLYINLLCQNMAQLSELYGENNASTIISNCDTLLFLGCNNDAMTADAISKRAGTATIRVTSEREQFRKLGLEPLFKDYAGNVGEGKRNLLNSDEVERLEIGYVLVIVRGQQILKLKRFDYDQHPLYPKDGFVLENAYDYPLAVDKYEGYQFQDPFAAAEYARKKQANPWTIEKAEASSRLSSALKSMRQDTYIADMEAKAGQNRADMNRIEHKMAIEFHLPTQSKINMSSVEIVPITTAIPNDGELPSQRVTQQTAFSTTGVGENAALGGRATKPKTLKGASSKSAGKKPSPSANAFGVDVKK